MPITIHAMICFCLLTAGAHARSDQKSVDDKTQPRFTDVTNTAGIDFKHVNGMQGERWLAEIIGSGVGVFDFDNDGRLDLWLVQGGPLADRSGGLPGDQLLRNVSGAEGIEFVDVTASAGVVATGYGMGIATGDVDNDGDLDVFLANYGRNQLFMNLGNGRFAEREWFAVENWSVSASFVDYDGDGWIDLYVANYVDFTLTNHKVCHDLAGRATYCTPEVYAATSDRLYRNRGDGQFDDVTGTSGIGERRGNGLGVVAEDFDNDHRPDFYVANDAVENLLWLNQGDGKFVEQALLHGVAVNGDGKAEASMGIAAQDFDRDCDVDLFMTHLAAETNTLYVNDGEGWFTDRSNSVGLAASSAPFTGFGTAWFDVDSDGDLDVFSANGAVTALAQQVDEAVELPLRQVNQLWLNEGGTYNEVVGVFPRADVSRGAAFGDLDNDGDIDVVVANNSSTARVFRNDTAQGHWLGVEVRDDQTIGTRVALTKTPCTAARVASDGSYASANDMRIVFGLGRNADPQMVEVKWLDGSVDVFGPLQADRYHVVKRMESKRGSKQQ